jgi:hypothetical protein
MTFVPATPGFFLYHDRIHIRRNRRAGQQTHNFARLQPYSKVVAGEGRRRFGQPSIGLRTPR